MKMTSDEMFFILLLISISISVSLWIWIWPHCHHPISNEILSRNFVLPIRLVAESTDPVSVRADCVHESRRLMASEASQPVQN